MNKNNLIITTILFLIAFLIALTKLHLTRNFDKKNIIHLPISLKGNSTQKNNTSKNKLKQPTVTLIATGDVVLGRSVNYQMIKFKNFSWPFENIKEILKNADLSFISFEAPLVKNCPTTVEGMVFCGDPRGIKGLIESGVDIVNLASNHMADYGQEGIENTVKLMEDNGIKVVGIEGREVVYQKIKGITFAFLGFNDITGGRPPVLEAKNELVKKLINEARKKAEVVIVGFHWGTEYRSTPDQRQIELARLAAESGADLIIGNHPHWIQNDEYYKKTYIKYAHGNLIFDQMWSEETKKGVIGRYFFENNRLKNKEFIPVYIENYGQPRLITPTLLPSPTGSELKSTNNDQTNR